MNFSKIEEMNLVIDVGNTRIKTAVFKADTLIDSFVCHHNELLNHLETCVEQYPIQYGIISKVANFSALATLQNVLTFPLIELNSSTEIPFVNTYKTPHTLGIDRIALVAAAVDQYPMQNVLVIDAGTCITYDFVRADKHYLGGAIAPGIQMRYQALHTQTAALPKLDPQLPEHRIGKSTEEAIHSGVIFGVLAEIEAAVNEYIAQYQDLTVVLTGGDTNFLAKRLKSSIFANQKFLLEGLNSILIFNTQE